jgi:uncharacterized membrane protein YcaP (DUF421 family)
VENGCVCQGGLAKELLSEAELLTVAHRQGFASLDEVQSCLLEPGGAFYIEAKEPRPHERHHAEVMKRMDQLSRQIDDLRQLVATR